MREDDTQTTIRPEELRQTTQGWCVRNSTTYTCLPPRELQRKRLHHTKEKKKKTPPYRVRDDREQTRPGVVERNTLLYHPTSTHVTRKSPTRKSVFHFSGKIRNSGAVIRSFKCGAHPFSNKKLTITNREWAGASTRVCYQTAATVE